MNKFLNESTDYSSYTPEALYEEWVETARNYFPHFEETPIDDGNLFTNSILLSSEPYLIGKEKVARVDLAIVQTKGSNRGLYVGIGGRLLVYNPNQDITRQQPNDIGLPECYIKFNNGEISREKRVSSNDTTRYCSTFKTVLLGAKQAERQCIAKADRYKQKVERNSQQSDDNVVDEAVSPKMTPQEKIEAKKAMQEYRNDPEKMAIYFAARGYGDTTKKTNNNNEQNMNEDMEDTYSCDWCGNRLSNDNIHWIHYGNNYGICPDCAEKLSDDDWTYIWDVCYDDPDVSKLDDLKSQYSLDEGANSIGMHFLIGEKAKDVEMMDKVLRYLNNEEAVYETAWLMDGPPDEATEEDYLYIAEDPEYYDDVCDMFKRYYSRYAKDGLYNAPDDVVEYAHNKDKEFGLEPIQNLKDEWFDESYSTKTEGFKTVKRVLEKEMKNGKSKEELKKMLEKLDFTHELTNDELKVMNTIISKYGKVNEDYSSGQEDWGKPYTIKECTQELSELTNDFTEDDGMIATEKLDEKNLALEVLRTYYKTIEVSDARESDGEPMRWAIAYSNPRFQEEQSKKNIVKDNSEIKIRKDNEIK